MELTSEQIAKKTFVIRAQGYDRDEVGAFLRLVAEQLGPSASVAAEQSDAALMEIERLQRQAEEYADHVRASADAYAEQLRNEADRYALAARAGMEPGRVAAEPLSSARSEHLLDVAAPQSASAPYSSPRFDPTRPGLAATAHVAAPVAPSVTSYEPAAPASTESGLPSAGLASLDSLVDDVMSDVLADFNPSPSRWR